MIDKKNLRFPKKAGKELKSMNVKGIIAGCGLGSDDGLHHRNGL
jgi:hypothetical protein